MLSLTYSLRNRYQQANRSGINELSNPQNLTEGRLKLAVYNSIRYRDNITRAETELGIISGEAIAIIRSATEAMEEDGQVSASEALQDLTHP